MKVSHPLLPILLIAASGTHTSLGAVPIFEQTAPSANGCTLRIQVDGLRNSTGVVGAAIFKSADGWPEDMNKSFRHWPPPIEAGSRRVTAVMENLPPGEYGVVAIHDQNMNQKLDRNFFGIPKE